MAHPLSALYVRGGVALACCGLGLGCRSISPPAPPPLPPLPAPAARVQDVATASASFALAPSAPRTPRVVLSWTKNDLDPATITEVYASTNLSAWYFKTNVSGESVILAAPLAREFFKIRNRNGSAVSPWCVK